MQKANSLRVAIDGAQSTGKTTLWAELKDKYGTQFAFIPEASREIAREFGIHTSTDWGPLLADPNRLEKFFCREEEWLSNQERLSPFVVDSSLFLIQAYRSYFGLPLNEVAIEHASYHILFYCPPINDFVADGFRFLVGRKEVDRAYRTIVEKVFRGNLVELRANGRLHEASSAIEQVMRHAG